MRRQEKEEIQRKIDKMGMDEVDSFRWEVTYSKWLHKEEKIFISNLLDSRQDQLLNEVKVS